MTLQPNQNFSLDLSQETTFINFLNDLPKKPSTTIRVFDRGEYYTVHGNDANYAAKEVFKSMGVIKYMGKDANKLEYAVLSKMNFENFARDLLLVKRYCLELYKGSSKNDWTLINKASPGNIWQMEDTLFANMDLTAATSLISVKIKVNESQQNVIGVSFYQDGANMTFKLTEFVDSDQLLNFESMIVHLNPKECLLPSNNDSNNTLSKIQEILERNMVLVTERKKSDFDTGNVVQDLNKLLKFRKNQAPNVTSLPELELKLALGALSAVIKYLELLSNENCFGLYTLERFDLSLFMALETAASKALNLFSPTSSGMNGPQNLYSLLNKCRTPQGQRLLHQWIEQPLVDINKIEERLNVVEIMVDNPDIRRAFSDTHLRRMPDFQRLARKFLRKRGTLQDVYKVYQAVKWIPSMLTTLNSYRGNNLASIGYAFCERLSELMGDFGKFEEMVETMLDLKQIEEHMEYMIKPDFDEELTSLRSTLDDIENQAESYLKSAAHHLRLETGKSIKLECNNTLGYCYRVTKKEEKCLRGESRFNVIDTSKNGVRFQDKKLQSINETYLESKASYEEHQKVVVAEIVEISSGYVDPLLRLSDITATLDVLISFAEASQMAPIPYVRPTLLDKEAQTMEIIQARNPCIELQEGVCFIPNDITFQAENATFYIITGPNMGGKSTYIRTVGVIVLMAQIGCFVPCERAKISVRDAILARVGAGDCQHKGVSTFMAEMLETTAIIKRATKYSLIIIDELGRGTSTYDGFGLAWAISEHIADSVGAFALFATHFHELTELSNKIPTVKNVHVTALTTDGTLTLLYKVKGGVCDRSFGIDIARMAHFPPKAIEMAKEKADKLGDLRFDNLTINDGNTKDPGTQDASFKQESRAIMEDFLLAVKDTLESSEMDEHVKEIKIQSLAHSISATNNPYIKLFVT